MKKILAPLILLITITADAQNHLIGIKGGVSWSNASTSKYFEPYFKTGFSGGITYDYVFKKYFSTGLDITFDQRGFLEKIFFMDEDGNMTEGYISVKNNYNYISLPLKIGFQYGESLYGFLNIGIVPSFLINGNFTSPDIYLNGILFEGEKINITKRANRFDLSGLAEIGGGYKFKGKYWLYLSFIFQHSFIPITNDNYFRKSKIRPYSMIANIGFKYK